MAASDTSLTIIIVIIFIALYLFNLIVVGMKRQLDQLDVGLRQACVF